MPRHTDPRPIAIIGAGGFGRECLDIIEALQKQGAELDFVGFADDGEVDTALLAARSSAVICTVADLSRRAQRAVIAIGSSAVRSKIAADLANSIEWAVLVHPQATLGSSPEPGAGTILNAGARVTTNVRLGRHVQLHANSTVGHDARLSDFVSVYPGATIGGAVQVGEGATIGAGACVLPRIEIGPGAFVGAGAVVTRDVPPNTTVAGVPARSMPMQGGHASP